jgi:hypothetical protein
MIREQVEAEAEKLGGIAQISDGLLDEVTALVEYPVALTGKFEEAFLEVPAQALISSMVEHPKHFHILDTETREIEAIHNPLKMFHKIFYDDTKETLMSIKKKQFSELKDTFVKVIVTNKNEPYWFDVFIENIIKASPADLKVVEDHSNLDVLDAGDFATEAEDTLTILTKHIDSLNIDGDKKKLDVLMRSLYTESLDILV